jgi:hypothetical protein
MSANTASVSILSGRKLSVVQTIWWILFVLYTGFTIFDIGDRLDFRGGIFWIYDLIYILENIVSWVLAITLFRKRPSDWTIILVTVMFFSGVSSDSFWSWMFRVLGPWYIDPAITSHALNLPFEIFRSVVRLGVFLTFPTGQWISTAAKRLFWISIPLFIIVRFFLTAVRLGFDAFDDETIFSSIFWRYLFTTNRVGETISYLILSSIWVLAGYMLFTHYRQMKNSVQRQQIKWIVVFFFMSVCASAIVTLINVPIYFRDSLDQQSGFYEFYDTALPWFALLSGVFSLGLVVAFSLSIYRYRLWDVDNLINKTLVYGTLTALLGVLFLVSSALINYLITKWFGEADSSAWAAAISALPVATAFNPLRERLQAFVDQYFKPEEVDFSGTFVEFQPEIQEMLTSSRIIQIVSDQVTKQLNVDFAKVYLLAEDSHFHQIGRAPASKQNKKLVLEEQRLAQLKNGKVVVDEDGIPYSLLVPLVVPRARIPDFLGVIMLGRRMEGIGYSSQILKNLQALGADAGKAIYLSRLSEEAKQKKKRSSK